MSALNQFARGALPALALGLLMIAVLVLSFHPTASPASHNVPSLPGQQTGMSGAPGTSPAEANVSLSLASYSVAPVGLGFAYVLALALVPGILLFALLRRHYSE